MSDDQNINQFKEQERLKIEIPVEEEASAGGKQAEPDLIAEMKNLGRQFADALRTACFTIDSGPVMMMFSRSRTGSPAL